MFERFTERALQVIMMSQEESRRLGHNFVGTEQILLGLLGEGCGVAINAVREYGITMRKVRIEVERLIGKGTGFVAIEIPFTPRAKKILEMSIKQSKELNHSYINTEHIFLALLNDTDGICCKVLQNLGANIPRIKSYVLNELDQNHEAGPKVLANVGAGDQNQTKDLFLFDDLDRASLTAPNLLEYTTDLTESAERAKLDPVVGRQNEIERVIQILSRRRKNNPILIGEPGVGKTAVAEGLAQRIIQREVPSELHEFKIFVLDVTLLLAGTKYRGEFEERLKRIVQELKEQKNIVIVIDEVHTLVGAGAAEGALDAANILKPALARGELQCIGATTIDEYRQHIEKDAALERRFQPVWVNEPSIEETITILKGLRLRYEQHHRLEITNEALVAAANLGAQYIADRFLPDKAIDLIDEGSARVRLVNYRLPEAAYILDKELRNILDDKDLAVREQRFEKATEIRDDELSLRAQMGAIIKAQKRTVPKGVLERLKVGAQDIASIVALWTGVPVTKITKDENTRLLELESVLHTRVIGQKEAVSAVARAVRRARVGMRNMKRPIASFFFSGPTGVGKTELTKTLASFFFGAEDSMVRLDMSEFMERHTVAKLIGSPPGYIGYNEGGQLTEAVRRKPYTVVLFDEVEKAHPDVFNLLLQILEDGRLTDSKGRIIDFKNTILIMTSNLGSKAIQNNDLNSQGIGFGGETGDKRKTKYAQLCNTVGESLKAFFKPEFLNRIDEIIVFEQLTKNNIKQIAVIMVKDLIERVKAEKEITLSLTPRMMELLIEEGFNPTYGARPLRRALVKLVEDKVSLEYLRYKKDHDDEDPVDILVDVEFDKVKVSISKTIKIEEEEPQPKAPPKEVKKYKISLPRNRTQNQAPTLSDESQKKPFAV
uniref:ATP-dependent Clp protease ATP-binding subunit clpA-like protein n=1 Tax=Cutleria multifida TaxID=74475 RepID=UPI002E7965B4|nr:ATP-dependent Clp protease ATP-binding subunit clpA-like protein [Cutleria multifida]WAM62623.1 ATP-dependent Clp protease ATP-binding subunit clpA-like protein [Cutleria multifida]